ncbi:adenosine deaminase 2 [Lampetra fluviatilis]
MSRSPRSSQAEGSTRRLLRFDRFDTTVQDQASRGWGVMWALVCATVLVMVLLPLPPVATAVPVERREELLSEERAGRVGGALVLSPLEVQVNASLARAILDEVETAVRTGVYPPAIHFFKAKPLIEHSAVFQFIRRMPKGAALHLHDVALASVEWLVKNVTYRPHCYVCLRPEPASPRFKFSVRGAPSPDSCRLAPDGWELLADLRRRTPLGEDLDSRLMRGLTMVTEDPAAAYPNQNAAWRRFEDVLSGACGLVLHAPVFRDYFARALQEFYEDGVSYIELRTLLPNVYDLDGRLHGPEWVVRAYQDVSREFSHQNPGFLGVKIISSINRKQNSSAIRMAIEQTVLLRKAYPDFLVGFDLVGQEDSGSDLWSLRDELERPAKSGINLPYFLHAGETSWEGAGVDVNVLDALLFNTTRIGHGLALVRHPLALRLARSRDVPVELCPISNQVLGLVADLRSHPASVLFSRGHPIVVSSDDPAAFGSRGLSYDLYGAVMGVAGGLGADLATLKQLALNSVRYSAMATGAKAEATRRFHASWDAFVQREAEQLDGTHRAAATAQPHSEL